MNEFLEFWIVWKMWIYLCDTYKRRYLKLRICFPIQSKSDLFWAMMTVQCHLYLRISKSWDTELTQILQPMTNNYVALNDLWSGSTDVGPNSDVMENTSPTVQSSPAVKKYNPLLAALSIICSLSCADSELCLLSSLILTSFFCLKPIKGN